MAKVRWLEFPLPADQAVRGRDDLGVPYPWVRVKLDRDQALALRESIDRVFGEEGVCPE